MLFLPVAKRSTNGARTCQRSVAHCTESSWWETCDLLMDENVSQSLCFMTQRVTNSCPCQKQILTNSWKSSLTSKPNSFDTKRKLGHEKLVYIHCHEVLYRSSFEIHLTNFNLLWPLLVPGWASKQHGIAQFEVQSIGESSICCVSCRKMFLILNKETQGSRERWSLGQWMQVRLLYTTRGAQVQVVRAELFFSWLCVVTMLKVHFLRTIFQEGLESQTMWIALSCGMLLVWVVSIGVQNRILTVVIVVRWHGPVAKQWHVAQKLV